MQALRSVRSAQLRSTTSPRTRWKQGSKSMTKNVPTITTPTPTKKKWGDISSYDMCLDSGKLGYEMCAEIIADTVKLSREKKGQYFIGSDKKCQRIRKSRPTPCVFLTEIR